ncbi:MAG: hypothetical protein IJ604_14710 [Prevotella sp.]|nr:hypothetical protein [Prevotella sp.]MBR1464611.1 hypothetical protein [Prevotella sp.]
MTAITINIPDRKVSFFKKLMTEMGWTYEVAEAKPKARLYEKDTEIRIISLYRTGTHADIFGKGKKR